MTTMLPYTRQPTDTDDSIGFDPEPGPLPDAMIQNPIIHEILYTLAARFTNFGRRADNFLESNTFICYDRSNLNVRVAPDCYLAFGVDAFAIRRRRLYLPWEVGKPPDFALEVASESTGRQDVVGKRRIYAQIGIPEYWRFDPTGGQFHGQPLAGDRLVNGVYQPIALTTEPDGVLKGYSPILGLSLCWHDQQLYFYDPATETYLKTSEQEQDAYQETQAAYRETQDAYQETQAAYRETQAAYQETQAALESERVAHQETMDALQSERDAREAAQDRIRQLEEQLRRLQSEG